MAQTPEKKPRKSGMPTGEYILKLIVVLAVEGLKWIPAAFGLVILFAFLSLWKVWLVLLGAAGIVAISFIVSGRALLLLPLPPKVRLLGIHLLCAIFGLLFLGMLIVEAIETIGHYHWGW